MNHRLNLSVAFVVTSLAVPAFGQATRPAPYGGLTQGMTPLDPYGNSGQPVDAPQVEPTPAPTDGNAIDLVILLDTSGSMSGLIDQARAQLWSIVNRAASGERDGNPVVLRVAVFEYGNDRLPVGENYVRQLVPLTDNLDAVSAALFSLTTDGGSEYCGAVIDDALGTLDWAKGDDAYRTIFIAGNEPFTQGPIDYRLAVGEAKGRGIVVNTIHCGDAETGRAGSWVDGATAGGGEAFNIDHDRSAVPVIICPQDERLIELGAKLNETYLWYGDRDFRSGNSFNQVTGDARALEQAPSVAADRVASKAGNAYRNVGRDLVDTFADDPEALDDVAKDELPEVMQEMTEEERVEHLKKTAAERKALQDEVATLSAERATYMASQLAKRAEAGEETLGGAIVEAIERQMKAIGFTVEDGQ